MFLRTKLGILYIGIACVCAMSGCSSKNATDTGNIRVSTGIKENIKVDTDVKVDTNTDAKKENPYSEIDKGTCIYIWEDTENKELYKSYVPLEDKIDKKDYFYKDSKVKILSTYFAYPTVSSEEFSQLAKALAKCEHIIPPAPVTTATLFFKSISNGNFILLSPYPFICQ